MTGLPTLLVELDDGTGTFPHDATAKCLLGPGYTFSRGREDEQSSVTAGSLSLTLNNSDGRFSLGSTTIDSPSPIVVDQRIRLKETVNGVTYTRFTGYVKAWPVSWPGTVDTFSVVQITATDAQARAERCILRSYVEEEILLDSPSAYYTLGEPAGATSAADTSGNQAPALTMAGSGTDVVFGNATGPGTDGLTAAEFAGGKYLSATLSATPAAMECYFSTTTTPAASTVAVILSSGASNNLIGVFPDGKIHTAAGADLTSPVVTDGATHCLAWESGHVYLDGVDIGAPSATPSGAAVTVGGGATGGIGAESVPFTGAIAHVGAYGSTLSAARALAHSDAGSTGFAGESGTDRITRLAGYAGIPLGTLDTSQTNVAFKDITGASAWSAIQDAVDAEGGLAYINGSGNLIFLNRFDAPTKTTPDITIDATFVTPDTSATGDDQAIKNYLETTAEGTGVAQVVRDTTSEDAHGRYSDSKSYLVSTDAEALDRANWIVANHAEPSVRFGSLTINLLAMTAAQQSAAVAALEPGCWLRVTNLPSQTPGGGTSVDLMVEGIAPTQNSWEWKVACNVVSRDLYTAAIYDNATYGVYDQSRYYY